ncbi:MAG TPA: HEAT repeat domain-containing protein [Candidatus Acidoferrales bacterium]|nr:HEAT repeat domain-containing protein [Candidatus Acidoferrales bacterium]
MTGNVYFPSNRVGKGFDLGNLKMTENDYGALKRLEDAFERKDLPYFKSFLQTSGNLPLLLRVHSVCMLEHIGDEEMVEPLCQVLKHDSSPLTRHEAAFTLGQLGYRSAVRALVEAMLQDESPIVRHESAVALSSIGDSSIIPELKRAIDDKDEDVSNSALIAYEYLTYLQRRHGNDDAAKTKIRL